jgi:hypothetical protein
VVKMVRIFETAARGSRRAVAPQGILSGLVSGLALALGLALFPAAGLRAAEFPGSVEQLAPPAGVVAADTPNDPGGSISISWKASPGAEQYRIERAESPAGPFASLRVVPGGSEGYSESDSVGDGQPLYYRVAALRGGVEALSAVAGPAVAGAQWFHTGRINTLVCVVLLSGLIVFYIDRARRGRPIFIRRIAGLDAVDEAVGRATEMGRKILYIPGTSDMDNVQTLAAVAILGRVARMTAQYEARLEVPVSRSLVMVAARETVREAYMSAGRSEGFREEMVYYLTDDQFGYAAALDGIMVREHPATIFLQGNFYAEALILAETGNSVGAIQIAGTAESSQLPFFVAACDYTLIGEELFLAGAYLSKEPQQLGSLKGQDMAKALILVLLLVGIVLQSARVCDFAALFNVQ